MDRGEETIDNSAAAGQLRLQARRVHLISVLAAAGLTAAWVAIP